MQLTSLKYKQARIDCLRGYPSHWDVKRLRYLFNMTTGLAITKDNLRDLGIPCINYGEIHSKYGFDLDLERDVLRCVDEDYVKNNPSALLEEGDFVFCDTSEDVEGSGSCVYVKNLNGSLLFAGSHTVRLHPADDFNKRFFAYLFKTQLFKRQIQSRVSGIKVFSISQRILKDAVAILPPLFEQCTIVEYLDRETAMIDQMLAAKEKLLKILDEKRRAIITHAVTKGVNPSAKLKSSGITWLGDYPAHWHIRRLKYLFRLVADPAPENNSYELLSLYTDLGVHPRRELEARGNIASNTDGYWFVKKGDLIVNKLLAWMGAFGVSDFDGVTSPAYDILRANPAIVDSMYYHYLFRCGVCFTEFRARSTGIMDMRLRLYFDQFGDMPVSLPPLDEQHAIVEHIKKETTRIDAMCLITQRSIELLKERRSALITDAVTGKTTN
jgi:type I restriction enzyme S subunit